MLQTTIRSTYTHSVGNTARGASVRRARKRWQ